MPLSRPEPLYFWVYFVFMNVIWIVVPSIIILISSRRISRAVGEADRCVAMSTTVRSPILFGDVRSVDIPNMLLYRSDAVPGIRLKEA